MDREVDLMVTGFALVPPPGWNEPGLILGRAGTAEAIGPLAFDEIPHAVALGAKPASELFRSHGCIHRLPPLYMYDRSYKNQYIKL